jgi:hypothetical protein
MSRRRKRKHYGAYVASATAVGAWVALAGHPHHYHHSGAPVLDSLSSRPSTTSPLPAGIGTSRLAWAKAFLREIPEPVTGCNKAAVVTWETAEGGGFGNQAANNPLNVNPPVGTPWPGEHAIGAWAFPRPSDGLHYTVLTILNGNYPGILAALHQGNDAQAVANAIENSPWAQSHYHYSLTAAC